MRLHLAVAFLLVAIPAPAADDLAADSGKGRDLLKQGDDLADKNDTVEAVLRYKLGFEQILPGMRKVKFKHEVKRDVTARESLRDLVKKEMDEDATPEEQAASELGMKALGLIPRDLNLKEVQSAVLAEEIAAFYDPKTKTMHLIREPEKGKEKPRGLFESLLRGGGGFNKDENKTVIAHELTHALADQNFDLTKMMSATKGDDDRSQAVLAVIEGEATMTMLGASMQDWDGKLIVELPGEDLDRAFRFMGPMLNIAGGKALRDAPPILAESMIFPYLKGVVFCVTIANRGGWKAIDAAYKNPPLSTEQVLHPEKYRGPKLDLPTHVDLGKLDPGPGWKELGRNVVGEMQAGILLRKQGGKASATGWDGDRFAVFSADAGRLGLVWLSTWDTEADARKFALAYGRFQTSKLAKGTPDPEVFPDSIRRPEAGKVFAIERRGKDVAVVEGFASEFSERLLESAFAAKKAEMTPAWLEAEAASKAKPVK